MEPFLKKITLLLILPLMTIMLVSFLIPPSEIFQKNLLYAQIDKNDLLKKIPNPRIILLGGSNLSLGLDSERIMDSLKINVINTGVEYALGIKYMLRATSSYIKEGDIIIISPEYQHFFGDFANGETELLYTVIDVLPQTSKYLDLYQCYKLIPFMPTYIRSKFKGLFEKTENDTTIGVYDRKSFNTFGDATIHWEMDKKEVAPFSIKGNINNDVFFELNNFRKIVNAKKAILFITFPCFQDLSFANSSIKIKEVELKLKKNGFNLLSNPERYIFPDSLTFDTPYHLIKKGVDLRTSLLIQDIKKVVNMKKNMGIK